MRHLSILILLYKRKWLLGSIQPKSSLGSLKFLGLAQAWWVLTILRNWDLQWENFRLLRNMLWLLHKSLSKNWARLRKSYGLRILLNPKSLFLNMILLSKWYDFEKKIGKEYHPPGFNMHNTSYQGGGSRTSPPLLSISEDINILGNLKVQK